MASEEVEKEERMKFPEYVTKEAKKQKVSKAQFMRELAEKSGVAFISLYGLSRGSKLVRYDKAKNLSEATGNKVTIKELCEE
mgnify:CR=1 FL=1